MLIEYKDQIENLKLVIDVKPRYYLRWEDTEEGRDKNQCWERIETETSVYYVNFYNRNSMVFPGDKFWYTLEELYNKIKE